MVIVRCGPFYLQGKDPLGTHRQEDENSPKASLGMVTKRKICSTSGDCFLFPQLYSLWHSNILNDLPVSFLLCACSKAVIKLSLK